MIIFFTSGLFIGVFLLMILGFKIALLQKRILRLIQEKEPELYRKFLRPKQFESLGLPNTFLGFPIWPNDDWQQIKFFLSSKCLSVDEEVYRMREHARKLMFAYLIAFALWVLLFLGTFFLISQTQNQLQWISD